MHYTKVCLESFASHLPDEALTSAAIESELSPIYEAMSYANGYLEGLTGIRERRLWPRGTKPSSVAGEAARKAMAKSAISPDKIDLIIHTGVCRDALEPSTANVIHDALQLGPHCMAFDLSNACLGFLNGMIVAANMIELGQVRSALVVTGENAGPLYQDTLEALLKEPTEANYRKNLASLTLGSGAVAFVLAHRDLAPQGHRLLGGVGQSDSSGHNLCRGNGDVNHQIMETDTVELMKRGLILSQITWELFKREMQWDNETPKHFLTHQISKAHQAKVFNLLRIDPTRGYSNSETLGNTGSAAAPLSLVMAAESGAFQKGDRLAILGIGSGINTLMLGMQW